MKIIICDDEQIQLDNLKSFLQEYSFLNDVEMEVLEYHDASTLWWDLQDGLFADLLLLDIQMEHMNGIELAHKMREHKMFHQIAFVSGIKDYVFEGYEVEAMSYILKPYEKQQIFKLLDKVKHFSSDEAYTIVHTAKQIYKLYHREVAALEAINHDTRIYFKKTSDKETLEIHMGLNELVDILPPDTFVKVHRSYVVNINNVTKVEKNICCIDDLQIPIARGNYDRVMQAFIQANRR